jgi:Protein of unknown function (DUF2797)
MDSVGVGHLRKMISAHDAPVKYTLKLDETIIPLNTYLGKKLKIQFLNTIHCTHCGRKTNKSFGQGYCYPCFSKLAQCDSCIVKPEKCHYHLGTCREPQWGEEHCMIEHVVYLANSSGLKVGITRHTQIPTRWIDQGATQALPILRVATRRQSGLVEMIFKQHVADKTHWQKMLKAKPEEIDMAFERDRLLKECQVDITTLQQQFGLQAIQITNGAKPVTIEYPVLEYPTKVTSLNLDKNATIEGTLLGIKGQYLLFDVGVINIRSFTAYQVEFYA